MSAAAFASIAVAVLAAVLVAVVVLCRRVTARSRRRIAELETDSGRARADADRTKRTAERLARALESIPQGVVVYDQHGAEVFRNEAASELAGARHANALVAKAVGEQLEAALAGTPQRRELDLFGPPRRTLEISAVGLDDGTDIGGAVAVIDDVSERRRLEAVRRDFVANISHELKTPVGALGLLAETIAAEDDPVVTRRLAERMTGEAFRVARIIDDLLDLTRIEAEETAQREPVAIHAVVAEAVGRVRPLAESRRITIDTRNVARRHTVSGDRRQLVSAVANLLENACKYSEPGSAVEVASRSSGSWLDIEVCDHGIGIPASDLERVFERFYRVDRARSRDTGGTGLGLAIVRHVASNHRGVVRVRSREGEGSTFTLRLPSGHGATSEPATPPRSVGDGVSPDGTPQAADTDEPAQEQLT